MLLYELLVGALPFDPMKLRRAAWDEMLRIVREEEPPTPSTRLSTLGEASADSAMRRRVDLSTLRNEIRGDLDWITMKALEKDRTHRYGSPFDLAEDLRRHLNFESVLARPPGLVDALRRTLFAKRPPSVVVGIILLTTTTLKYLTWTFHPDVVTLDLAIKEPSLLAGGILLATIHALALLGLLRRRSWGRFLAAALVLLMAGEQVYSRIWVVQKLSLAGAAEFLVFMLTFAAVEVWVGYSLLRGESVRRYFLRAR